MHKSIDVKRDLRTMHDLKVPPPADTSGEKNTERGIRLRADEKSPDIWGELGKRLERILRLSGTNVILRSRVIRDGRGRCMILVAAQRQRR